MRADIIVREILRKEGLKSEKIAAQMDKSPRYLHPTIYGHAVPNASKFSQILDICGYDLIARSRDDGFEFLVTPE